MLEKLEEIQKTLKESMEQSLANKFERLYKEEKTKRQSAEGELSIIKGIGNNSPEMKALQENNKKLKKELDEVKKDNKILSKQIEDFQYLKNK
jgi:predicted RNase H-like nuclease (RuvC/YqgF family)|tara:strand:+ start:496 stop:774 length:279 start_codon:yes stop_codon:yes gene_type:complete